MPQHNKPHVTFLDSAGVVAYSNVIMVNNSSEEFLSQADTTWLKNHLCLRHNHRKR